MADALPTAPSWLADVPLAHRGLHDAAVPENSLAAFRAASEAGIGVELDVWLSRDGQPVVVHDRDLRRVADDPRTIASLTVDELRAVRLAGTDEHVPTLAEVLDVLGDTPAMVEVKRAGGRPGVAEAAVAAVVAGHTGPSCVASFDPRTVAWFARHEPAVVRVQTAGPMTDVPVPPPVRWALRTLRFLGRSRPHAVSYDVRGITAPVVARYRDEGGTVVTWTVRDETQLATARRHADNVIFESLPVAAVTGDG